METGKKIFYLSPDTGKESGNISTPDIKILTVYIRPVFFFSYQRELVYV